jgi:hypothetical protein
MKNNKLIVHSASGILSSSENKVVERAVANDGEENGQANGGTEVHSPRLGQAWNDHDIATKHPIMLGTRKVCIPSCIPRGRIKDPKMTTEKYRQLLKRWCSRGTTWNEDC